jgi:hypothetical protein
LADGVIQQITVPEDPGTVLSSEEARNADDWYMRIVLESFGT